MSIFKEEHIFEYDLGKDHESSLRLLLEDIYYMNVVSIENTPSGYWHYKATLRGNLNFACKVAKNKITAYEVSALTQKSSDYF